MRLAPQEGETHLHLDKEYVTSDNAPIFSSSGGLLTRDMSHWDLEVDKDWLGKMQKDKILERELLSKSKMLHWSGERLLDLVTEGKIKYSG